MAGAATQYEIPYYGSQADRLHGWLLEAQQEGSAWLDAQRPARAWSSVQEMLSAVTGDDGVDDMSNVGYNKGKRIARELVAALANFRHEGEFGVTWDQSRFDQAHVLTNLDHNWYKTTGANMKHRAALQYAVAKGTGYLWEIWNPRLLSPYRGDIDLIALDPGDVTFVQLPKSHDIQQAYAVIIREELPINLAKAKYAGTNRAFVNALVPDRESPGWIAKGLQKVQQFLAPGLRVAGRISGQQQTSSFPTVDIFHMYTLDMSTNDGPLAIPMGPRNSDGSPAANWSYTVPALGDPIPTGINNPQTGNQLTRPATWADTKMFPFRRYTIFSRTAICYDGTSSWWHGAAPVARIRFNDWAWEALGATLVGEVKTMQVGIEALMRLIEDSAAARLDPPMLYDDSIVSSTWAKAFNARRAGARAAAPLQSGKPIEYPVDPAFYNVPEWIPAWIDAQEKRMDYVTGVTDLVAIAKAQQIPGADTLEKLMEMAGPIVQDLVRQVEEPLYQLGEWRKAYYLQFYTTDRMIMINGPDGVDVDVLYQPTSLIPPTPPNASRTQDAQRDRAIRSLDEFQYTVTESGINEIHRMTTKLFYLQLMKEGFPISPWTFARIAQIPNFGPPPEGTNTEMERWIAWRRMQIELEADVQVEGQLAMQRAALEGGMVQPGGTPGNEAGGAGAPGTEPGDNGTGGPGPGRPNSYNAPPQLKSKDGGTRTTVSTSR